MKRIGIGIGLAAALSLIVGLNAAATQSTSQKKGTKSAAASSHVTLTGCLQKGDTLHTYKLTNATMSGGTATGTTGTSAGAPSDWELTGAPASLKLNSHVGHKVEVTGTKTAAAGTAGKAGQKEMHHENQLRVRTLKMVAESCS